MKPLTMFLLLLLALLAGAGRDCRTADAPVARSERTGREGAAQKTDMIQNGMWGGKGIVVRMTDDGGGATVDYDCAHGTIERIKFDSDGAFEAEGTHTTETLGPNRRGAEPLTRPARYTGRVSGDTMTLTVTLADSREEVGTFSLGRGRPTRIVKCK